MPTPHLPTTAKDLPGETRNFRRIWQRAAVALSLALGLPLLTLLGLVLILLHFAEWVDHSDRIIAQAMRVKQLLLSSQTDFRAYRLANDESYLNTLGIERRDIEATVSGLSRAVADNPQQGARLSGLREEIGDWFEFTDAEVAKVRGNPGLVRDPSFLKVSGPLFTKAEASLDGFTGHELLLRQSRTAALGGAVTLTLAMLGAAASVGIPALAFWLRRLLRTATGTYEEAARTAERAEAAHKSSEKLKAAILEASLDGFILMNHEGRIVDWNPAAERIFGATRAETAGKLLGDTIVPERLRAAHRQGLARYFEKRESRILGRRLELPALRADGSEFLSELSITHIPGTEPPLFAGFVRNITERRENELALKSARERAEAAALAVAESAERFRLLSEVVPLQVWTARPDGELDFANAECGEYFGVEVTPEVLGHAWVQFVHPEDVPVAQKTWMESLTTGKPYEVEFRLRRADGAYRWFLVRGEAMRNSEGGVVKWFGSNTDIDDLKAAQDKAERASRAKDNFLAALSHELRTPLTPVLLAAAELKEDPRLPAEARVQLGMMERNIGLEARLIDDLLDLTRISKGKMQLRPQLCDAHSLIHLAIDIAREEARAKDIVIETELAATRSGLTADPSRFEQVIWNLLRNAIKFTPGGGSIRIKTRDSAGEAGGQWLSVEVSDSGVGIERESIGRIFEPFEQALPGGEQQFGGIGLGLAIARAILDMHGGTIRAESEGAGRGATFVAEWPGATRPPHGMAEPPEGEEFAPPAGGGNGNSKRLRLLLVEDNQPTLQVLARLLVRVGHEIAAATSVSDALAAAAEERFDGVISDLGLPDGSGNDLMRQLRDKYNLRGIALTGYGMEEDLERSHEAGFVMHIIKPVDFSQLRRALTVFESREATADPPASLREALRAGGEG